MSDPDLHFENVDDSPLDGLIGSSSLMKRVFQITRLYAKSTAAVLILGETGTGKELIAKSLHELSDRSHGPFVKINCGALTETLLESELFGHVKGSFTDAVSDRAGRFEAADGGTIFLDEVNSMTSTLQVKLLRVLQEQEFQRVGDSETIKVNVRIVAASNCDLNQEVVENRFREDLYWRLNVLPLNLPPLRRRPKDIEKIAQHYLQHYSQTNKKQVSRIHPDAMKALVEYPFPGNVRELQNYIERAIVLARGDELSVSLLPKTVIGDVEDAQAAVFRPTDDEALVREFVYSQVSKSDVEDSELYKRIIDPVEKEMLIQVLDNCNHTQTKAAKKLGINRNTLYQKLVKYGLAKSKTDEKDSSC
jgi:transcriptional regulator with PAS, ATPase and Fis domain